MNLKKLAISLTTTCLICSASFAFEADEVSLGGIKVGTPRGYVHTIYGKPDSEKTIYIPTPYSTTEIDHIETYGDSVVIDYVALMGRSTINDNTGAFRVKVTKNNGWATEQGATVGMSESDLLKIYGKRFSKFVNEDGITCYDYGANHSPIGYAFGIKNHKVVFILIAGGE